MELLLKQQQGKLADYNLKDTAFVIGNGTSRSTIPLIDLIDKGTTYGCNALYREFSPDYLIAVDVKMIVEINKSRYQNNNSVWTNPNKAYSKFTGFNFFNPSKGWSSGPTALFLASEHSYKNIYILGFDFVGINNLVNNMYADTPNYKKSSDKATYYNNWLKQTYAVISKNPNTKYFRVVDEEIPFTPKELQKLGNLSHITVEKFKEIYNIE